VGKSFIRLAVALVVYAPCASVRAGDVTTQQAREHYRIGTRLYDLQRYLEAAAEYEKSFELKEEPALLFNIGQAYRLGGDSKRALGAYRAFLRRQPDAPQRDQVQALIEDLRKTVEAQQRTQEKPPTSTIPSEAAPSAAVPAPPPSQSGVEIASGPPPRRSPRFMKAGIGVGAAGVVLLALGGGLAGESASEDNALNHPTPGAMFDPSLESRSRAFQSASIAMFAIGGVAVAAGVTLLAVGSRRVAR
jgi:tetratricopeptide (TPR) repeat protein